MEINKNDGSMNFSDYSKFFVFVTFSAIVIYVFYKAMF